MPPQITSPTHSRLARLHPRAYLWVHVLVGLGLSAAFTWIFFAIAEDVPENGAMVRVDAAVTDWLQRHGTERGESIFVGVSYLGAQLLIALIVILAVVLIARRDWRKLMLLGVTCAGGAVLNAALKSVFHRARPMSASEFHATSWSFPSGHAMNSLIVYGLFAYWLTRRFPGQRRWILLGTAVLVGAIGYSRIYLGVHYLSDVFAGYSAGLVWLIVCISGDRFAERRGIGPDAATAWGRAGARYPGDSLL